MADNSPEKPYRPKPSFRTRARSGSREGNWRSVGDLLGATLGKHRLGQGVRRAQPLLLWPQAVGPEVARLTKARSFQFGTLHIEARDSAVAHHLSMQRHHFQQRLNDLLQQDTPVGQTPQLVTEIRFGTGFAEAGEQQRAITPPLLLPPLPQAEQAKAKQVAELAGADLLDVAQRAAEAVAQRRRWREQQGWQPCPVCGEPSPHTPCRPCEHLLQDPLIQRTAAEVIRQPQLLLSLEDRLGVAGEQAVQFLATAQLRERLQVLVLECVASGSAEEYREFLEEQCAHLLAVMYRKAPAAVTAADYAGLPEQVRAVLLASRRI